MKKKLNLGRLALSGLVALALLYVFFRGTNLSAFWNYLKSANLWYLLGFAAGLILFYWLRAIRWIYLFKGDNVPGVFSFFLANLVGFSVNYILPGRLGEIARAVYISKKGRISSGYSIATVVVERFFDFFSIGVMVFLYLLLFPVKGKLRGNLNTIVIVSLVTTIALVGGVLLLLWLWKKGRLGWLKSLLRFFPGSLRDKLEKSGKSFLEGLNFFSSPGKMLTFILLGLVVWLEVAFQYWLGLKAFGIDRGFFSVIPFIGVLLVGVSIPTPGMAGGFEVASKFFIVEVWKFPPDRAVAATLTLHVILLLVTLGAGALVGIKEGFKLGRRENEVPLLRSQ